MLLLSQHIGAAMRFKGILFDKDGTLIEADGTWVPFYRSVLMRLKGVDEAEADAMMALAGYDPVARRMKAGSIMAGGTTRQLVDIWWAEDSAQARDALIHRLDNELLPDVEPVLEPLADLPQVLGQLQTAGYKLAVATNDSFASASRHMEMLAIHNYFHTILGSDKVAKPKPSGLMIRRFSELSGIAAAELVMVGDNFHDIEEARQGGAGLAIGVLSGNGRAEDLRHIADHVLQDVSELPAYLEGLRVL
jgi:phosphoglycolate phosphatase